MNTLTDGAKRMTQVAEQTNQFEPEIKMLFDNIERLEQRLSPLTSREVENEPCNGCPIAEVSLVPFADEMRGYVRDIGRASNRLNSILHRLEL